MGTWLILWLFLTVFVAVKANLISVPFSDDGYCDAHDSECNAKRQETDECSKCKDENKRLQDIINDEFCKSRKTQCQNNGTCFAFSKNHTICQCPSDYGGENCEKLIKCHIDCGPNAVCAVVEQQPVCQCLPGFTRNSDGLCVQKTYQAIIQGDPHYVTFDGLSFSYHGRCWAYLMRKCNTSDKSFEIRGINNNREPYYSMVQALAVAIRGREFQMEDGRLTVNNILITPPYIGSDIFITFDGRNYELTDTVTGANVKYQPGHWNVIITVPATDFFVGTNNFCGILGNIDDDCTNDFRFSDGRAGRTPDSCKNTIDEEPRSLEAVDVCDSHIISHEHCQSGRDMGYPLCPRQVDNSACSLIDSASKGQGPLAACANLSNIDRTLINCRIDGCYGVSKCAAYTAFVASCLAAFPLAKLSNWRQQEGCPYQCGLHSTYSIQTPICQKSCARNANVTSCLNGFKEGCVCDPGYLFDHTSNSCVAKEECGCLTPEGNYYPPKTMGLIDNCTKKFKCAGGDAYTIEDHSCGKGHCAVINHREQCVCDKGYKLNGTTCIDADKCLHNPKLCGANIGHGTCNNTDTDHICTCTDPWFGPDCATIAPRRHCADLMKYRNISESGVYTVFIGAQYAPDGRELTPGSKVKVFCEMISNGGGWTLISGDDIPVNKTFAEYEAGFGTPTAKAVWLGLDNIHTLTTSVKSSLWVLTKNCDPLRQATVIYPSFSVLDSTAKYAVVIPLDKDVVYPGDGWVQWSTRVGPKFQTFDNNDGEKETKECIEKFKNAGWWYLPNKCDYANLNAQRTNCANIMSTQEHKGFLAWDNKNIKEAFMYVRPADFPNYK